MKYLIYEDSDGKCKIVVPGEKFQQPEESEDSAIHRLYNASIPNIVEFFAVEPEIIPKDLSFREAWRKGTIEDPIKIDFDHAMDIHRRRIQKASERKIAQLNLELERAIEDDNLPLQVAINRTKKVIRTFHELNLTHCKTIEDIKFSVPKELRDVWEFYPL